MDTMKAMPAKPQDPVMTGAEFRRLLERAGLNPTQAADRLAVGRSTVWRWLRDVTPISKRHAILIKSVIRPTRK